MANFKIPGDLWFEGVPDGVIWSKKGAVTYRNPAAIELGRLLGWDLKPGAAVPRELIISEPGATAVVLGGCTYLLRNIQSDNGLIVHLRRMDVGELPETRVLYWIRQIRGATAGLIGAAQLLERQLDGRTNEKIEQYLAVQRHSQHKLLRMINSVEQMTRPRRQQIFGGQILDFGGLCKTIIRKTRSLLEPYGYRINLEDMGGNHLVFGEERDLTVMVYQLLANAIGAAGERGAVTLRLEQTRQEIRVTVTDSGKGLEEAALATAFDPGMGNDGPAAAGLGLGLSLCQATIREHGGKILLFSGNGGRVVVTLPLHRMGEHVPVRSNPGDYDGGMDEALVQLADVLPWQCYYTKTDE